ncbi:DinB family protein [Robertmurraya sp. P23]|uniref:DinB family protein n=1 Tax=Robertmurraya sp. P23 TaxID=3436931 RepID=UPI003D9851E2
MMHYTRVTTINAVNGLSKEELDYLPTPDSNSIGMLLSHIAALEYYFQINTFENIELSNEESQLWKDSLFLGEDRNTIKGNDLSFYLEMLQSVRETTLNNFKDLNNEWLYETCTFLNRPANNLYKWFHVFEDELNHRGQIRMIVKRLKK